MDLLHVLQLVGAAIAVVGGGGGIIGVVILWGKQKANEAEQKRTKDNFDLMVAANNELRTENREQRDRHDEKLAALRQELVDERVSCSRQIGELQGHIQALTGTLAEQIVAAAAAAAARVANAAAVAADGVLSTAAAAAHHPTQETA
jgi:hypothetical protein